MAGRPSVITIPSVGLSQWTNWAKSLFPPTHTSIRFTWLLKSTSNFLPSLSPYRIIYQNQHGLLTFKQQSNSLTNDWERFWLGQRGQSRRNWLSFKELPIFLIKDSLSKNGECFRRVYPLNILLHFISTHSSLILDRRMDRHVIIITDSATEFLLLISKMNKRRHSLERQTSTTTRV